RRCATLRSKRWPRNAAPRKRSIEPRRPNALSANAGGSPPNCAVWVWRSSMQDPNRSPRHWPTPTSTSRLGAGCDGRGRPRPGGCWAKTRSCHGGHGGGLTDVAGLTLLVGLLAGHVHVQQEQELNCQSDRDPHRGGDVTADHVPRDQALDEAGGEHHHHKAEGDTDGGPALLTEGLHPSAIPR